MSDLEITPAALQGVRDKAMSIESIADRSVRQLGRLSPADVGPPDLVARVGSFGEEWIRGMRQLGVFGAEMAESLDVVDETLTAVDERLSATTPRPE
ncbi:hypothetical protein [Aeromicrobium wangtongii]|uniref:Excreted virulence factor EspC, type VII ESX diderm n=1 Tax=Aeromicrobium wangtongii TaxID=2969247 RepID=A0ABY5M8X9_9ACTN|nr:hypothetical protein [Aeromicrobium wangtongii]MCD9199854.1 hypothetical protein [Aeromicrobium wangtongii]UUP13473.1 hypothetical protein NQV15_16730 [Aeromicrobium wangtongii]